MTQPIREISPPDLPSRAAFEADIMPAAQPVVLRGLVADWPSVGRSVDTLFAQLKTYDSGALQGTLIGQAGTAGKFHYAPDLRGQNYDRVPETITQGLDRLRSGAHPDGAYIQSIPLDKHLPKFADDHPMRLVPDNVHPRAWIGTPTTVQTHFDPSENIACVVLGEREVTLFPPNQLANLYPGPLETAPGGTMVSLTNLDNPDFDAHPKFRAAMDLRQTVTLCAGDGIYIPYGWWHHIRALSPLNMLVNYWWTPADLQLDAPYAAMAHAMMDFKNMPLSHRRVWADLFQYFVFNLDGDAMMHLPEDLRGVLGGVPDNQMRATIHDILGVLGPAIGLNPPPRK